MDFILHMDSSKIADSINNAFKPTAIQSRSRCGAIVEFQVQKLDESGRLGKCLDKGSESTR